jgi:predicted transcriptional regulator
MLLLSIRPQYVEKILSGQKLVELRKRKPRSQPADWLAIYECAPTMALVAIAQVADVDVCSPRCLWGNVKTVAGVTKKEFDAYFENADQAVGIRLAQVVELARPILLAELRIAWPKFNPPQGFIYLSEERQKLILDRIESLDKEAFAA